MLALHEVGQATAERVLTAAGRDRQELLGLKAWLEGELNSRVNWREQRAQALYLIVGDSLGRTFDPPGTAYVRRGTTHLYLHIDRSPHADQWHLVTDFPSPIGVGVELLWEDERQVTTLRAKIHRSLWRPHDNYAVAYGYVVLPTYKQEAEAVLRSLSFRESAGRPRPRKVARGPR